MTFYDRTRRSPSIPARLRREGNWHLLPLYHVLMTSDLARKAVEGGGSWKFADHIYRRRPAGRFGIGTLVDALLLSLPSARALRTRYVFVREQLADLLNGNSQARVLSIPGGIPRDLVEAAARQPGRGRFTIVDLDPQALEAGRRLAGEQGVLDRFGFVLGDAFDPGAYPEAMDAVTTTGFTEFLPDDQAVRFLSLCREALAPGGVLLTAATARHPLSDRLLRQLAELEAHYRGPNELRGLLERAGFRQIGVRAAPLQSYAVASGGHR